MEPNAEADAAIETDALVIGAGPVGLFLVFELGLLEIRAHVVDALDRPGGQCAQLYPDKPIYDIPAVQATTGYELAERLQRQIAPFAPVFHLGQEVANVEPQGDGRLIVATSRGTRFLAKTVFIAAGVGAFVPRSLPLDGLPAYRGRQLHHRADDTAVTKGQDVVVVGSDEEALTFAVTLAQSVSQRPRSVTLMHRRDVFTAEPSTLARMHEACASGALRLLIGQATAIEEANGRLTALQVLGADGHAHRLPVDLLFVLLGVSPKLGPIAQWGVELERKQVRVDTETFQTRVPGLFAVGDVITYPGKRKLIVCGFHEATLAAYAAAAIVFPGEPIHLQYTTTSPRLHALLGVSPLT
jgi:thioredoxin reductase (NADPH)